MKKIVLGGALLLVGASLLTGCQKEEKKDPIVGKWALGSYVYTFNEDKTCQYDAAGTIMKCTYEIDGDNISILYEGNTMSWDTTFEIKDNKLNIKDSMGQDTIYEKQK